MRLTAEQQDRITTALERAGATLPCPRCGHPNYSLLDGYLIDNAQRQLRNIVIGGDNRVPCVATFCDRCGFLAQHLIEVLKIS